MSPRKAPAPKPEENGDGKAEPHVKPRPRATKAVKASTELAAAAGIVTDGQDAWPSFADLEDGLAYAGAQLLDRVADFVASYVAFADETQRDAVALFTVHAHAVGSAETSPRLSLQSPEKQSGKTRTMECLELLVPGPLQAVDASAPALYRTIGEGACTILLDEADTVWGKGGTDDTARELRAILNAGYRKGAVVPRCLNNGKKQVVERFPVYAPVILAGIGALPETLQDRSIVIGLKRRAAYEHVRRFRRPDAKAEAEPIRQACAAWAARKAERLAMEKPPIPDGLSDRAADCWEPLLAIADLAGGEWPDRARNAAVKLCEDAGQRALDSSAPTRMLMDVRTLYAERGDPEFLATEAVLEALKANAEAPWGEWGRGRGLTAHALGRLAGYFGIKPGKWRSSNGDGTRDEVRGYYRAAFTDSWMRYLPESATPDKASQAPQASQPALGLEPAGTVGPDGTVADGRPTPDDERICRECGNPIPAGEPGCPDCPF